MATEKDSTPEKEPSWFEKTTKEIQHKFSESLQSMGGATPDDSIFYRGFNALHRLDYFNPNVASNIHIFMTRPMCNFNAANIPQDALAFDACMTLEGCLIVASLMKQGGLVREPSYENVKNYNAQNAAASAYDNLKKHGINKLGMTPFIPIVSNLSFGISGIKDVILEKYEYDGDQAGNKTADPMGTDESQSSGECTIQYIDNSNLGVTILHHIWMNYMDKIGKGLMIPDIELQKQLIYDYMSSIYWFVTGPDGFSIKLYGKLTGVFPLNVAVSGLIPERGQPVDPKSSFNYHYNHSEYMNPEILYDFNYTISQSIASSSGQRFLANEPIVSSSIVRSWKANNFDINVGNSPAAIKKSAIQTKYHRFMETDANGNIDDLIYSPDIQNQWSGYPWIWNGKLVYRAIK